VLDRRVAGVLVTRQTAPGEREILNLAVDPAYRGRGIAWRLMQEELDGGRTGRDAAIPCSWYLEVRESNTSAIHLYETLGFTRAGRRERYYDSPPEAGVVMRFRS
jgi:ribosomal-protein-alanine N-acetyltransferase